MRRTPPKVRKYARRAKVRRRDWHLPRRYVSAAIQVDDGDAAFLLIAEARVATATALLSTIALGVLSSLGAGTMMIIPVLLLPQQCPG